MKAGQIIKELLASGLVDWVSLHDVVWLCTGETINEDSKLRVQRVLERIYADCLMVPGDLGETGFEDWESSPEGWVARSTAELDQLDWRPMGAGFWLRLTPRGEQVARSHISPGPVRPPTG